MTQSLCHGERALAVRGVAFTRPAGHAPPPLRDGDWADCSGGSPRAALRQLPLPGAKMRTRFVPAVELETDPERADDDRYVEQKYDDVQASIQRGMDALARERSLPLFG